MVDMLSNAMKNEPAICMCYKEDTSICHIQHERLPKYKMASSDGRFTFMHVLHFGSELNEELCCGFISTNLQQSLDLLLGKM